MKIGGALILIIFALFWATLTLGFDFFIGREIAGGLRSRAFAETTGRVRHSEVTHHRGSKGGTTYGVDILYEYEANGVFHAAKKLCYGSIPTSSSWWAYDAVRRHPAGSETRVFFDPQNPSDAVLEPGLSGASLFMSIFIAPFNVVMIGLCATAISAMFSSNTNRVAGGVRLIQETMRTRVRMPRISAMAAAIFTLAGSSFASVFIVGFSTKMNPSVNVVLATWGAILGVSAFVFARRWLKIQSGAEDLVLDEGARTLTLPLTFGRKQTTLVPFDEMKSVEVKSILHRSNKGGVSYTYAPALCFKDSHEEEKLADWPSREKAEVFAAWLREKIGLAVKP